MKLGINSSVWEIAGIGLEKSLDYINNFGFKYVDILAFGSANPEILSASDKNKIINKFQKFDLKSSSMVALPPGNIASTEREERDKCFSYLRSCAEFQLETGGKQLLIGLGGGHKTLDMSWEQTWMNSVSFLKSYCEYLYNLNMFLIMELEPLVYCVINNTSRMVKIIEDVGAPNLFANIDIGHLSITREPPKTIEKLKHKILHVHISDNNGETHANWIIGTGVTPVSYYLNELSNSDIDELCSKYGEEAVASIEIGTIGETIDDPDYYISESLKYLYDKVPEISR